MNRVFAEHVTNTAFFLSISKKQVRYISILKNSPWPSSGYFDRPFANSRHDPDNWVASYRALVNKGLATWVVDDTARGQGHYELTKAGHLTCSLLVEAGMLIGAEEIEKAA